MYKYVERLVVILGESCNLQCKYCLQHDIRNSEPKKEISDDVLRFISKMIDAHKESPLKILLYGGEPLVYWDTVKELVGKLPKDRKKVNYALITNGKLLDEEKVAFMNENEVHMSVSWDGDGSKYTRGYDAVKDKHDLLIKIKHLGISSVLSSKAYPYDLFLSYRKFDDEYSKMNNGRHIPINYALMEAVCDNCKELLYDIDPRKMKRQIHEVLKTAAADKRAAHIYSTFMSRIISMEREGYLTYHGQCSSSNCPLEINLTLDGKLWFCHNERTRLLGTIEDFDTDPFKVIQTAYMYDKTREIYEKKCSKCEVYRFCCGGCPLTIGSKDKERSCEIVRAYYRPFLHFNTRNKEEEDAIYEQVVYDDVGMEKELEQEDGTKEEH